MTFPSQQLLTRFSVPGVNSLLWSRPQIPSESSWLPHNGHVTVKPVGISAKIHPWARLNDISPQLWKLLAMWKLAVREEASGSVPD